MDPKRFTPIVAGDPVPGFWLTSVQGKACSTHDLIEKKNLVIFFFASLEDTGVRDYLEILNAVSGNLQEFNAQIIAISLDDEEALREYARDQALRYELLVDRDTVIFAKYFVDAQIPLFLGAVFITDKSQLLYKAYGYESLVDLPDAEELIETVELLEG